MWQVKVTVRPNMAGLSEDPNSTQATITCKPYKTSQGRRRDWVCRDPVLSFVVES